MATTRAEILHRLSRIERYPDVLDSLLGHIAQCAGRNVEAVIGTEAGSIYRDALGVASLASNWVRSAAGATWHGWP